MCKVSVLMPVYNAERYLAQAIDSIIEQTYTDWELIIVNDGSSDTSEEIILSYDDPRIRYIRNEQNQGLIKTLNKGLTHCEGEYIARMDADDISLPDRLKLQTKEMELHSSLILCGTNAIVIDSEGKETGKIINPSSNTLLQISLLFTNPFVHPSVMIRKGMMGNDKFDQNALHIEDFELWTRLADKGELMNIDQPLIRYRWHETNVSVKHSSIQEDSKNKLIASQLNKQLSIHPDKEELETHRITFRLYHLGSKNTVDSSKTDRVVLWFSKLSNRNRELKKYPQADFDAFLWSRWAVLCLSTKQKSRLFFPRFIKITPKTLLKTLKLIIYLSRK